MLKKTDRAKRKDFGGADPRKIKRFSSDHVTLVFIPKKNERQTFSVVVSKNISKKAVFRNKLKRMVYSEVEKNRDTLKKKGTHVFYMKTKSRTAPKKEIEESIREVIKKAQK